MNHWGVGIYLEACDLQTAMVRPIDGLLIEGRTDRESATIAMTMVGLKKERALRGKATMIHFEITRTRGYTEWDEDGILTDEGGRS